MVLHGHNSAISFEYCEETTYGSEPGDGILKVPSDWIMSVNMQPLNNAESARSIGSYDPTDTISGVSDFSLDMTYKLQRVTTASCGSLGTSLEWFAYHRQGSETSLQSFTAYYTMKSATAAKRYRLLGCRINTHVQTIAPDGGIDVAVNILGKSCSTDASAYTKYTGTGSNERGTSFELYKTATVTRSFNEGLGDFTVTCNNGLDKIKVIGTGIKGAYSKDRILEGTGTVLLADTNAGLVDFGEMDQLNKVNMIYSSGASSTATNQSLKWTFSNSYYKNFPVNLTPDTTIAIVGMDWGCEGVVLDVVT